jgi:hypothetical protein
MRYWITNAYSAVPPCISPKLCFDVHHLPCLLIDTSTRLTEYGWLTKVQENFKEDTEAVNITLAVYHADISIKANQPLPITAMLPLLHHSRYD